MTSRDACSCLNSAASRLRNHSALSRISRTGTLQGIHNHSHRSLTTETQATETSSSSSAAALETLLDAKLTRRPRLKKDHYYKTSAGVLLCRSPIITRELSEFERAFYAYQRHLKSRLSSPFPTDFYFTKGSLASKRWQAGEEARRRANDLQPTAAPATPTQKGELTGQERELQDEEEIATTVAMSRTTEADAKNDTKSLERKLDRTLYLLLKKERGQHAWQLPQGTAGANEALHESSARILSTLAGRDMHTWPVGRVPIGHLMYQYPSPQMGFGGNKVYFMKNRIFAGQCVVQKNAGIADFGWFTREEMEERVAPEYWKAIHSMIASQ